MCTSLFRKSDEKSTVSESSNEKALPKDADRNARLRLCHDCEMTQEFVPLKQFSYIIKLYCSADCYLRRSRALATGKRNTSPHRIGRRVSKQTAHL